MSFASSVTFNLSLKDLIQGLGDSSWVLVEGWEGGASGRVKSQLPSLGLGHVWGTTYIPRSLWKQAVVSLLQALHDIRPRQVSSFFMSCFHLALTGFSGRIFLFLIFAATRGYSVMAVHWLFNPVLLLMLITGSRALRLSSCAHRLSCPGAFTIFPNQVSSAYLKHWIKRESTLEGIWNKSLLYETWQHGLFMRRKIEDCPYFQQPPEISTDWGSPPKGSYRILKLSCHVALFLLQFLNPTLDCSFQRAGLSLDSLLSICQ